MKEKLWLTVGISLVLIAMFCAQTGSAEVYPARPVDLIVAYTPGGGADLTARLLSTYFSKKWGIQLNVINKPGGGGIIATREVLQGSTDGYTMLVDNHASSSLLAAFQPGTLPFDWRKRSWLARNTKDPVVYIVRADAPWKSLAEVADFVQKNPKKLRWGTTGVSGISCAAGMQLWHANHIQADNVSQVMFAGEVPIMTALAGGHIDFGAANFGTAYGMLESKRVRPLAITSAKRAKTMPEIPTTAESGYPMIDAYGWHGITGAPGLPNHVVQFWVKRMEEASKNPMFIEMAANIKKEVEYVALKDFEESVEKEYQRYVTFAKELGVK